MADPYDYAKVNFGIAEIIKPYRMLRPGDLVHSYEMLAMVDTAKATGDISMKPSKSPLPRPIATALGHRSGSECQTHHGGPPASE